MGAVKNAMQRDELDPTIMDLDPNKSVVSQRKKEDDDGPPLNKDPTYEKYFRMLKMVRVCSFTQMGLRDLLLPQMCVIVLLNSCHVRASVSTVGSSAWRREERDAERWAGSRHYGS